MPTAPSASGTVVTVNGGTITDTSSNEWMLTNGQVGVNGVIDPATAKVIELAYLKGLIWQENASDLWWAKGSPGDSWSPTYGTPVSPLFVSSAPVSANDTLATIPGQTITDANHNVWSISAGGRVVMDGVSDPMTANVIALAYANGLVWQENANDLWWAKASPGDSWSPTYGTPANPLPASVPLVSANNTVVGAFSGQAIVDAGHNFWSISSGGQVEVNGAADPTTANVIALAYENGLVWQENADHLWWAKSSPGDSWSPTYGTATSPVPTRLWVGGADDAAGNPANWSPAGVPQPGDTLQIGNGAVINVAGNDLAGDTLNVAHSATITVDAAHDAQLDLSIPFATVNLNVADTATLNASAVHGVLNANGGTIQFIGTTIVAQRTTLNDSLTGNATVVVAGGQGEGGFTEVNGAVGQGLNFSVQGVAELQIDHPDQFAGALTIGNGTPLETVLLAGLTASSGTLSNGMLSLFDGNQLVDQLRVGGNTSTLTLDQTSAGVVLDQNHISVGGLNSTGVIPLTFA
ncbi:MAG TPA: hypothetical protein VE690_12045 [Rhodopila sp.]|nr:hypothetical protein [Rhodopila sp.]